MKGKNKRFFGCSGALCFVGLWLCCLLLLLPGFSGCSEGDKDMLSFQIAALNEGAAEQRYYYAMLPVELSKGETAEMAKAMIREMGLVGQADARAAVAVGTEANRVLAAGNGLEVDMPASYAEGALQRVSADGAIVLTLCQLPGVEYVRITVDGKPPAYRADRYLNEADFLLDDTAFKRFEYAVDLYFADKNYEKLAAENRVIDLSTGEDPESCIVNALCAGPENEGLCPVMPEGAVLLSQYTEQGVCYVNFSGEFISGTLPQGEERASMTLEAIARSLCALSGVDAVRFAAEGTLLAEFHGVLCGEAMPR